LQLDPLRKEKKIVLGTQRYLHSHYQKEVQLTMKTLILFIVAIFLVSAVNSRTVHEDPGEEKRHEGLRTDVTNEKRLVIPGRPHPCDNCYCSTAIPLKGICKSCCS